MKRLLTVLVALAALAAIPAVSLADATHVVRKGDTLGKIARAHHVSVAKIQEANGLEGTHLSVGNKARHSRRQGAFEAPQGPLREGEAGDRAQVDTRGRAAADAQVSLVDRKGPRRTAKRGSLPPKPSSPNLPGRRRRRTPRPRPSPHLRPARRLRKRTDSIKDRLLRVAQRMLAVPYRFGGTTLWGLDCSGFVQKTFAFLNLDLPRSAREQFREGAKVAKADLSPGDLVFFRTYAKYPSHVGIYLGDNRFVHASSRERKVTIDSLDTPYYVKRYIGAKRLLFEENDIQN